MSFEAEKSRPNCTRFGESCPEYPCEHIPCDDPDWLADMEDGNKDRDSNRNLWRWFHYYPTESEALKAGISKEDFLIYETKFDRCRRLEEKWDKIDAEIREYWKRTKKIISAIGSRFRRTLSGRILFTWNGKR